jgi:hypothetical protein
MTVFRTGRPSSRRYPTLIGWLGAAVEAAIVSSATGLACISAFLVEKLKHEREILQRIGDRAEQVGERVEVAGDEPDPRGGARVSNG